MTRPALWGVLALVLASCQVEPSTGRNVALLYGVSRYDTDYDLGKGPNLSYPTADVAALAPLLDRASGGVFPTVLSRTDSAATKAQMAADIAAAASQMDADSLFLFYYSGHGDQGNVPALDGHAVLIPYGSYYYTGLSPVQEPAKMVTENELRDLLATLPTKKVVVILDSCFSGGFLRSSPGSDPVPQDAGAYYKALWKAYLAGNAPGAGTELAAWFSDTASDETAALASWTKALAAGSGFASDQAQLLTAAGALERSYDAHQYLHGAFTHFLLEAKDRGDADGNGFVTVSEAYRYAFAGLQEEWNGIWGVVGAGTFVLGQDVFLPHLSSGPVDYLLFRN